MWDAHLYNAIWDCKTEMIRVYGKIRPDHPLIKELIRFIDEMDNVEECDDSMGSCTRNF